MLSHYKMTFLLNSQFIVVSFSLIPDEHQYIQYKLLHFFLWHHSNVSSFSSHTSTYFKNLRHPMQTTDRKLMMARKNKIFLKVKRWYRTSAFFS